MAISDTTTKNLMATYYSTLCPYVAFHTADAATSANESTGTGSARGAVTWGTAGTSSAGVIIGTATVSAPTAGASEKGLGLWSQATGGTFRDGQFDIIDITYAAGGGSATVTISYTQS